MLAELPSKDETEKLYLALLRKEIGELKDEVAYWRRMAVMFRLTTHTRESLRRQDG